MITDIALGIVLSVFIIFIIGVAAQHAKEIFLFALIAIVVVLMIMFGYWLNDNYGNDIFVAIVMLCTPIYFLSKSYRLGLLAGKFAKKLNNLLCVGRQYFSKQ